MRKVTTAVPAGRMHAPASQEGCNLLLIPPELRNRIYEALLLLPANEDGYVVLSNEEAADQQDKFTVLSILGTCQQIESEATGIFYAMNKLHVHYDNSAFQSIAGFVSSLGCSRRHAMRHLACDIDFVEQVTDALKLVHPLDAAHLTSLRLYVTERRGGARDLFHDQFKKELWFIRKVLRNTTHLQRLELVVYRTSEYCQPWDNEASQAKMDVVEGQINSLLKPAKEGKDLS
ncbi:hypothetical protein LTR17_017159 [Elasticomyces elasticus]|nr:hypothetical protein LTR17_017159 [Elasticomyces elasticus]